MRNPPRFGIRLQRDAPWLRFQLRSCAARKGRNPMSTKVLVRLICIAVLLSISAFAVDGVVLINQNTVIAAGGFPYHITQAGSYRLTSNLVVTTANIAAD